MNTPTWDDTFLELAAVMAKRSKDRSIGVGAVIVGPDKEVRSVGYNGFPRGINDDIDARHDRPEKYLWTEHAERNAIYNAARIGIAVLGCTMYVTMMPCMRCSRAIIQSGIKELVCDQPTQAKEIQDRWSEEHTKSRNMLYEAGVLVRLPVPHKVEDESSL